MSGGENDEQQSITGEEPTPDPSRTVQEKILSLYTSTRLSDTFKGFWLKLLVETFIVTAPLFVIIAIPGFVGAYLDLHPWFTYLGVTMAWISSTFSIMAVVWCFTDATVESQD